jgi:hypothetical protein
VHLGIKKDSPLVSRNAALEEMWKALDEEDIETAEAYIKLVCFSCNIQQMILCYQFLQIRMPGPVVFQLDMLYGMQGADPNHRHPQDGNMPILQLAHMGNVEGVKMLLKHVRGFLRSPFLYLHHKHSLTLEFYECSLFIHNKEKGITHLSFRMFLHMANQLDLILQTHVPHRP